MNPDYIINTTWCLRMDVFELIYSDSHIFPRKPKPLCSCWIGDRMVDMSFIDLDARKINWGRAYKGHSNHDYDEFWENIKVIDEEDEKIQEYIRIYEETMWHFYLYLH